MTDSTVRLAHMEPAAVRLIKSDALVQKLKDLKEVIARRFPHVLYVDELSHFIILIGPHTYESVEQAVRKTLVDLKIK